MNTSEKVNAQAMLTESLIMGAQMSELFLAPKFRYDCVLLDCNGDVKWTEDVSNLVTTQGGNDLLDKYFKGTTYTAAWYLALKSGIANAPALSDTMASHGSWTEVTGYTGSTNRPAITFGTTAAKSNTATLIAFAINATVTIGGAFVSNTQATSPGNTGVMYSASNFAADRSAVSGDTLNVTLTVTC